MAAKVKKQKLANAYYAVEDAAWGLPFAPRPATRASTSLIEKVETVKVSPLGALLVIGIESGGPPEGG